MFDERFDPGRSSQRGGRGVRGTLKTAERRSGYTFQEVDFWRGGQATKGNRRMPWGKEPMKGVAHDDTPRGAASKRRSEDARMGKPLTGDAV
jgi:hypothetical protein